MSTPLSHMGNIDRFWLSCLFGFLAPRLSKFSISSHLTRSVHDEGYSNNASSALFNTQLFIANYKGFRNKELDELIKSSKVANR